MTALLGLVRRVCLVVGVAALAGLVVLPATQIVMRTVFWAPISGIEELTRYLLIVLTFAGVPLVTAEGGQIRMDELVHRLPRVAARRWRVIIAAATGAVLAAVVVAVYSSIELTLGSSTPTLGIPFWLFNLPAIVGLLAGALESARQTWRVARGQAHTHPAPVV